MEAVAQGAPRAKNQIRPADRIPVILCAVFHPHTVSHLSYVCPDQGLKTRKSNALDKTSSSAGWYPTSRTFGLPYRSRITLFISIAHGFGFFSPAVHGAFNHAKLFHHSVHGSNKKPPRMRVLQQVQFKNPFQRSVKSRRRVGKSLPFCSHIFGLQHTLPAGQDRIILPRSNANGFFGRQSPGK